MIRLLRPLARDERGASIIELALVAPFLGSLLIGMVDLSRGYSEKLQLEQAAQRAIEKAMNGEKSTDLFNTLKTEGATAAGVNASAVTVNYWLECAGVSQNTSAATMQSDYEDKKCSDGVPYARYVTVSIQKSYTPMFSSEWLGSNPDGSFTLVGEAGVRVQ
ncbi:MAG TPA: TadE/TadG family type IV pilus assembly protein [Sphingomicrobium sp.]|jgi:Flp pilus assembly protein TadG|nr:TadE/TadG family type IV pilus assembly protein [Sphingomicrobium sp.]